MCSAAFFQRSRCSPACSSSCSPRSPRRRRRLAKEFDFSGCRSVIDVGGGSGSGLLGLLEAYPKLRGTLFELPPIAAIAETLLRGAAHADRIAIEAGDITAAPPESRHDAAICMQLIQVLSPADAARAIA